MSDLMSLGALDSFTEKLLPLGRILASLPLDLSLGKMLVLGSVSHLSDIILTVAASLSVQSVFVRVDLNDTSVLMVKLFFFQVRVRIRFSKGLIVLAPYSTRPFCFSIFLSMPFYTFCRSDKVSIPMKVTPSLYSISFLTG